MVVALDICLRHRTGGIEAAEFLVEVLALVFDGFLEGSELSIPFQVDEELGVGIPFRQPDRFEKQAHDAQADTARPGFQRATRHVQAVMAFAKGRDLGEQIGDLLGKMGNGAGGRPVWKCEVDPEVSQDLGKVRFSAAVEATDPGCLLLRALEAIAIALEDAAHAVEVFAIAHEGFEFEPQRVEVFGVVAGDAFVDEFPSQRVFEEESLSFAFLGMLSADFIFRQVWGPLR